MDERYNPQSYRVGWICAFYKEQAAARCFLDEEYEISKVIEKIRSPHDSNNYRCGRIGKHNVVIAVLPSGGYGVGNAAVAARDMLSSFRNIKFGLMVGIGGGAPSLKRDIRLGDIVVSEPCDGTGGVLFHSFGKRIQNQGLQLTAHLNKPPDSLLNAVEAMKADHVMKTSSIAQKVEDALNKISDQRKDEFRDPGDSFDFLYKPDVIHPENGRDCESTCGITADELISRQPRKGESKDPVVHYGLIASGDVLMKDASERDRISGEHNILCFEMEAAGLMNNYPCLVVRGISDYADSHKNDRWQGYAAMTAAAYAKDLLMTCAPDKVAREMDVRNKLREVLKPIGGNINRVLNSLYDGEREKICSWLSFEQYEKKLSEIEGLIVPNTGQWFLDHDKYRDWKSGKTRSLFCSGSPGAGKTCLSALVVRDLLKLSTSNQKVDYGADRGNLRRNVIYYFCQYQEQSGHNSDRILSSALAQLGRTTYPFPPILKKLYDELSPRGRRPDHAALVEALISVGKTLSTLWWVIDALDELHCTAPHLESLVAVIKRVQSQCSSVKVLLTSRPGAKLLVDFGSTTVYHKELPIQAKREDLETYVQNHRVSEKCLKLQGQTGRREMIKKVVEAAKGIFLFLHLRCEDLNTSLHSRDLDTKLSVSGEAPIALMQAYKPTISRLEAQPQRQRDTARSVIHWIFRAKRPMKSRELQHALCVSLEDKHFDEEKSIPLRDIEDICVGLVTHLKNQDIVVFTHKTVHEYFEQVDSSWVEGKDAFLSNICMKYLQLVDRDLGPVGLLEQSCCGDSLHPFVNYAAQFCGAHASESADDSTCERFASMLDDHRYIAAVVHAIAYDLNPRRPDIQKFKGHVLVYFRLGHELEKFLGTGFRQVPTSYETCVDIELKNVDQQTMLHVAAEKGLYGTVQLLLHQGADVNAQDVACCTALHLASRSGFRDVVCLLVRYGANIEARCKEYGTSLTVACAEGHIETARALLDLGASVNDDDCVAQCPLSFACASESVELVQLLLDRDVDLQTQGKEALKTAMDGENREIQEMLLCRVVDLETEVESFSPMEQDFPMPLVETSLDSDTDMDLQC